MKPQNITVDINRLDVEELEQLAAMLYKFRIGSTEDVKKIEERRAFLNGWMNDQQNSKYIETYCS